MNYKSKARTIRVSRDTSYFNSGVQTSLVDQVDKYLEYIKYIDNKADKTVTNRKECLKIFLRDTDFEYVEDISLYDMNDYFIHLRKRGLKQSTIEIYKQTFRLFFEYHQDYRKQYLQFDWPDIKRTKTKSPKFKPLTRDDIKKVLDNTDNFQDRLAISVLFHTGIRIGELINIQLSDISGCEIKIRGKGDKDRVVFAPEDLMDSIYKNCGYSENPNTYIVKPLQAHSSHPSERYTNTDTLRKRIERLFLKILGVVMHPHIIRHSFAVDWVQSGGDIRSLQLILGHESIDITQNYLQFTDLQLLKASKSIHSRSLLA